MKMVLIAALLVVSQFATALPEVRERELSREKATEILASKEKSSKEKYLSKLADMAGEAGKVNGLSLNIKKALLQGDADLLMLVYKSITKKDEATLKFIGDASAGVKTTKEASALSKLATMTYTGNFKSEVSKEVENGKTLEQAIKAASKTIGKSGKEEITLEKILECLA